VPKRRIEIITETERSIIVTRRPVPVMLCGACGSKTSMITPEQAAATVGVSVRTVYRWAEAERLHFFETTEGRMLICANSLSMN